MANWAALLNAIAALLTAIAWPIAIVVLLFIYKARIRSILEVLTKKLESADVVRLAAFEIRSKEQKVQEVLAETSKTASESIQEKIPDEQLRAAGEVDRLLQAGQVSALDVVHPQLKKLVGEYDEIRNRMSGGPSRTRRMNEIAAKMRALGLAARPLLRSLTQGLTPGERLAAICILQVAPEFGYFDWLIQRIETEPQPFIFFQAAVAVLEFVKTGTYPNRDKIKTAILDAKQHISSFKGGIPDRNTIDVLETALQLVS